MSQLLSKQARTYVRLLAAGHPPESSLLVVYRAWDMSADSVCLLVDELQRAGVYVPVGSN